MLTRTEQIHKGKIWQVYLDSAPDNLLFEGNKTKCFDYIKVNFGMRAYKKGTVRIGQVIFEK